MYNSYFGFREKPFKLVPNPEYLFLSKSHEEALAHLNYAIAQGDGFVEITGEVGTGKTTLCRAFLENLDDDTAAAYIFNPKLGPKQLIKTINDEFGIRYNADDTKDLIDKLNAFLIQKKTERKKVIILIDEAQNLTKTVLEQLRLLSNLETNKEKLLQIILVGQPELAEMLNSHDLRQIGQRISLRYQIIPLSLSETREYIQYRLNIASQKGMPLFDPAAIRCIYHFSRGIPRLINIACDRALLAAFSSNRRKVTGRTAKTALSEMTHRRRTRSNVLMDGRTAMGLFLLICALVIGLLYRQQLSELLSGPFKKDQATGISPAMKPGDAQESGAASASNTVPTPVAAAAPAQTASPTAEMHPSSGAGASLSVNLTHMEMRASRLKALKEALEAWGTPLENKAYLEAVDDDPTYFNLSAKASGFFVQRIEGDLDFLRKLDMPAILEFRTAKPTPAYLTMTAIEGEKFLLNGGSLDDLTVRADAKEINQHWTGVAYVPWKNFLSLSGNIPGNAPADSVLALKMLLRDLGHADIPLSKDYDPATQKIVELLQFKYGLPVDGVVGSLTKIILYREGKMFDIPHVAGN